MMNRISGSCLHPVKIRFTPNLKHRDILRRLNPVCQLPCSLGRFGRFELQLFFDSLCRSRDPDVWFGFEGRFAAAAADPEGFAFVRDGDGPEALGDDTGFVAVVGIVEGEGGPFSLS